MVLKDAGALAAHGRSGPRTIVIGSGAAGLYAAHELARRGQAVVVIETGGTSLDSFAPESYSSVGRKHDGIRIGRSRSLGGTTNLWGGQLVEFQPIDFGGRDWLPDSKWPLSYDEIFPYYARTYENLGIEEGAQDDSKVLEQVFGTRPALDDGLEIFLTRWLKVPSFAVSYGGEIQSSGNLCVLLNHTAVGFLGSNGAIHAARVVDRSGRAHAVEGDHFILAAGTIEIARLLLHSATHTDWQCPWRDNQNVGAYFQDHLAGRIASVRPYDRQRFFDTFCTIVRAGHKYQPKMRLTNEALENARILNIQGWFNFESDVSENLVYLKQFLKAAIYSRRVSGIRDFLGNLRACGRYLLPLMWKYVVDNRVFVPSTSKISLIIQGEQVPLRESRIRIDPSVRDARGLPKVVLEWRLGSEETASIREFARRCARALQAAGLASLEIPAELTNGDDSFLMTLRDSNHASGGARMGASDRDGVVDRDLRVFGTQNLYVAGSATFRTTSNANTTFTALALVSRLVDQLTRAHAVR
jgi:choline dehydrogenase-like flavoprotein